MELKQIIPFVSFIIAVIVAGVVITSRYHYRIRKGLLNRWPMEDKALEFLKLLPGGLTEALKWALILVFGGAGLIVLEFIPGANPDSPLSYGIEAIFVSIGLFIFYFSQKRKS